jgi:hypothetical protein
MVCLRPPHPCTVRECTHRMIFGGQQMRKLLIVSVVLTFIMLLNGCYTSVTKAEVVSTVDNPSNS